MRSHHISTTKIKCLGVKLPYPYEENPQTQIKETEELNKEVDIACSWMGKFSAVKMSVLATSIYKVKGIH